MSSLSNKSTPNRTTTKITFILEDLDDFIEIMTSNSSRTISYQEYINDDDYYYGQQKPTSSEFFPILIILLTIFSILTILLYLICTTCCCLHRRRNSNQSARHPALSVLNHYLFLNIFLTFALCLKILTSPLVRNSMFYSSKSNAVCTLYSSFICSSVQRRVFSF